MIMFHLIDGQNGLPEVPVFEEENDISSFEPMFFNKY